MNTEDTDLRQRLEEATARAAEAEARLAEANARCAELQGQQRELVGALQHQVRNMLTVVRSVAQRSAETSESVEEYAMHLDGRLAGLASEKWRVLSVMEEVSNGRTQEAVHT